MDLKAVVIRTVKIGGTTVVLVTGVAAKTYQVTPLPGGTYFFHCDVHPTVMFGTFVVK